jgi:hypothetical protein
MKRFVEGEDRRQATLLPACLDDYVAPDNPVRIIEAFVDELDLAALGFAGVVPEVTGRPSYHPATLLTCHPAQDLHLRLPQPRPLQPPSGAGDPAQYRADLADRPLDARLQDYCRFPPRQRTGHPCGVCAVQGRNGQRALPPVRLRNIPSPGGQRAICPSLNPVVQIRNLAIKICLVGSPSHSIHAGSGLALEGVERRPEGFRGDVMEERRELLLRPVPCGLP